MTTLTTLCSAPLALHSTHLSDCSPAASIAASRCRASSRVAPTMLMWPILRPLLIVPGLSYLHNKARHIGAGHFWTNSCHHCYNKQCITNSQVSEMLLHSWIMNCHCNDHRAAACCTGAAGHHFRMMLRQATPQLLSTKPSTLLQLDVAAAYQCTLAPGVL